MFKNFITNNQFINVERNLTKQSIYNIDQQIYVKFLIQRKYIRQIFEIYFNNSNIEICLNYQNFYYLCTKRNNFLF